jgi:hypothetical protein
MTQPNVYWTLDTPLATIIGLHTNVPKYGAVTDEQQQWFREELARSPKNKLLIICLHHAPYSADINHGSSLAMIGVLECAFFETDVYPDIVFSGHVHNYQRFHKPLIDGRVVPYIVCGAGGFDELHAIAKQDDERFVPLPGGGVSLENYHDNTHGFLRVEIERKAQRILLQGNYFTVTDKGLILSDEFSLKK